MPKEEANLAWEAQYPTLEGSFLFTKLTSLSFLSNFETLSFNSSFILRAISLVENKQVMLKYKYIIIDEYQDTSYIRFLLIKKIIDNTNSKLMVVGDDFQSIYRFTGCDISLFLKFNNYKRLQFQKGIAIFFMR